MNLYLAAGQYVGTQAEAKALDKSYQPVEVPVDKAGLMAFLNALAKPSESYYVYTKSIDLVSTAEDLPETTPEIPVVFTDSPKVQQEDKEFSRNMPRKVNAEIIIEDAIAAADYNRTLNLVQHIHCRLKEHADAAMRKVEGSA
jgi:hypothetical protein